jgi:hypothetical protein
MPQLIAESSILVLAGGQSSAYHFQIRHKVRLLAKLEK